MHSVWLHCLWILIIEAHRTGTWSLRSHIVVRCLSSEFRGTNSIQPWIRHKPAWIEMLSLHFAWLWSFDLCKNLMQFYIAFKHFTFASITRHTHNVSWPRFYSIWHMHITLDLWNKCKSFYRNLQFNVNRQNISSHWFFTFCFILSTPNCDWVDKFSWIWMI